ncbi:LOW QUALITY PROTEIN: kinase non-catalytic C-lobe domain-containing protein 1 [Choloepus didactylus]|uniref:LOW QUALITY PROTEIN: kinase non-catalytic C-lobe domain-containing protein 1 n=1 Tax=Choloepus didactylus TaxID=27675 RepID=UPI00189FB765|nr:LOW QUALITY PROTEIN: kinase non-catalytic C-lobe domain-containing protein 1 [Choloepus didactylus]
MLASEPSAHPSRGVSSLDMQGLFPQNQQLYLAANPESASRRHQPAVTRPAPTSPLLLFSSHWMHFFLRVSDTRSPGWQGGGEAGGTSATPAGSRPPRPTPHPPPPPSPRWRRRSALPSPTPPAAGTAAAPPPRPAGGGDSGGGGRRVGYLQGTLPGVHPGPPSPPLGVREMNPPPRGPGPPAGPPPGARGAPSPFGDTATGGGGRPRAAGAGARRVAMVPGAPSPPGAAAPPGPQRRGGGRAGAGRRGRGRDGDGRETIPGGQNAGGGRVPRALSPSAEAPAVSALESAAPGPARRVQAMEPAAADFYEDSKDLDFYEFEPLPTLPEDEQKHHPKGGGGRGPRCHPWQGTEATENWTNEALGPPSALDGATCWRDLGSGSPRLLRFRFWARTPEMSAHGRDAVTVQARGAWKRGQRGLGAGQGAEGTPREPGNRLAGRVTSAPFPFLPQDDPEGAFVPPEFDVTGNTFEAHIYSLGATLKAAIEYVTEPELRPTLSPDLEALLGRMQAEEPGDRPDLQSLMALCEEKVPPGAACRLCRSLSAVGRRVLSIESFGAFPDVSESAWRGRLASRSGGPLRPPGDRGANLEAPPVPEGPAPKDREGRALEASWGARPPPAKPALSAPLRNGESGLREALSAERLAGLLLGDLDGHLLKRRRLRKVQTFPRLPSEAREAGALRRALTSGSRLDAAPQLPFPPLLAPELGKLFPEGKNGRFGLQAQARGRLRPEQEPEGAGGRRAGGRPSGKPQPGGREGPPPPNGANEEGPQPHPASPQDAGPAAGTRGGGEGFPEEAGDPGIAATEQEQLSLQALLRQLGRPFREYELWALCQECLRTLQAAHEVPAHLCLDSVLVAEDGSVLFGPPPADGSYNSFFVAPEVAEGKLATEKASMYCVAAVLWAAAKFGVPRDHKLSLPCRLKSLLLDMARRCAQERPSAAAATKMCSGYLLQRGMDSKKVLAHLSASTCQVHQEEGAIGLQDTSAVAGLDPSAAAAPPPEPSPGFVPVGSDARLVAVPSQLPSCPAASELPAAFTSPATHFKPIVLAQDSAVTRDALAPALGPAERPGEAHAPLTSLEAPETRGAATGREPAPQGSAAGCLCPPPPAAARPEGTLSAPSSPSPPGLPLKAQAPEQRPAEQVPPTAAPGVLGPHPSGPSAATRGPRPLPRPPSSEATEGPRDASQAPSLAAASPDGPQVRELGDRAPDGPSGQPRPADLKPCAPSVDAWALQRRTASPSLQEATRLIQEEFAFDGYLDNGLEAWIMGEHIYALRGLTYATFCGAISEKFCDLSWDDKLLQNLFNVVNGETSPPDSVTEEATSQPEQDIQTDLPSSCSPSRKRPSLHRTGKEKAAAARAHRAPCAPTPLSEVDPDELSRGNFEVGFRPQKSVKAEKEPPSVAGGGWQRSGAAGPPAAEGTWGAAAAGPGAQEGGLSAWRGPAASQSCSPGWSSAFYEAECFGTDVHKYAKELGRPPAGGAPDADAQRPELEQQLMIEKRNYRKTLKFYQKLLQKEKRNKGTEVKTMLSKLRGQLEEMKSKVQFLGLVKKYLQVVYAERWGLEPCALPVIVNIAAARCDSLDFSPLDESSSLIFYNVNKQPCGGRQRKARILQAGTPLGLMAYLYSSDAFLEGYVQQFLYTFRYFCTPHDFLQFLLDRISGTLSRAHQDPSSTFTKIYRRSLCLLQAWVEDCYAIDFTHNAGLLGRLEAFISSQVTPLDGYVECLLALLEVNTEQRGEGTPRGRDLEDPKEPEDTGPLNSLCKKFSEDGLSRKSFSWRLPRGSGLAPAHPKERQYSIASALPKPCFLEEFYGPHAKGGEKGPCFLTQCSTHQLFCQLTLLQQELFQKCHPVHFLNSRALGVMDKCTPIPKGVSSDSLTAKTCSLFLPNYIQDKYLLQLLRNAEDVSTWVAAEIVTSHSSKLQVNLLSKFLLIAKSCYEQRNFATAMQILGGLEHLAVRQSPAWRILPAKIAEVLEELKAVEVFLKSDSLCLMEGRRFRAQPTIPSARLLAMHIQQLETGGFTMTNGAHRWSKLRNIAKVVSQVHAFQENPFTFAPDPKLQSCLKQRITRFSGADVSILAADNRANFHPLAGEKHSRKIQDKLRRMKATFQ